MSFVVFLQLQIKGLDGVGGMSNSVMFWMSDIRRSTLCVSLVRAGLWKLLVSVGQHRNYSSRGR